MGKQTYILLFHADWSPMSKLVLDWLMEMDLGVEIHIEEEDNPIIQQRGIKILPYLLVYREGKEVGAIEGIRYRKLLEKKLQEWLKGDLENDPSSSGPGSGDERSDREIHFPGEESSSLEPDGMAPGEE